MKVFISWSGELSQKVAELLKDTLPCIINSVEPFYSSTDIEKGLDGNAKITAELSDTAYGIFCLTNHNVSAPWINFEAGAISQKLNSRISSLLVGINPSDLQGPLKNRQATSISNKEDFYLLIQSINKNIEKPLEEKILNKTFDMAWPALEKNIGELIAKYSNTAKQKPEENPDKHGNIAIEEILSLVRKQNSLLQFMQDPENLLPADYLEDIFSGSSRDSYRNNRVDLSETERQYIIKKLIGATVEIISLANCLGNDKLRWRVDTVFAEIREIIIFIMRDYATIEKREYLSQFDLLIEDYQKRNTSKIEEALKVKLPPLD